MQDAGAGRYGSWRRVGRATQTAGFPRCFSRRAVRCTRPSWGGGSLGIRRHVQAIRQLASANAFRRGPGVDHGGRPDARQRESSQSERRETERQRERSGRMFWNRPRLVFRGRWGEERLSEAPSPGDCWTVMEQLGWTVQCPVYRPMRTRTSTRSDIADIQALYPRLSSRVCIIIIVVVVVVVARPGWWWPIASLRRVFGWEPVEPSLRRNLPTGSWTPGSQQPAASTQASSTRSAASLFSSKPVKSPSIVTFIVGRTPDSISHIHPASRVTPHVSGRCPRHTLAIDRPTTFRCDSTPDCDKV